jgi:hypothetical protein
MRSILHHEFILHFGWIFLICGYGNCTCSQMKSESFEKVLSMDNSLLSNKYILTLLLVILICHTNDTFFNK